MAKWQTIAIGKQVLNIARQVEVIFAATKDPIVSHFLDKELARVLDRSRSCIHNFFSKKPSSDSDLREENLKRNGTFKSALIDNCDLLLYSCHLMKELYKCAKDYKYKTCDGESEPRKPEHYLKSPLYQALETANKAADKLENYCKPVLTDLKRQAELFAKRHREEPRGFYADWKDFSKEIDAFKEIIPGLDEACKIGYPARKER